MIRDALNELHQAGDVEIVKKVGSHVRSFDKTLMSVPQSKLVTALDVASFREVGITVNETVRIYVDCTSVHPYLPILPDRLGGIRGL